MCAPGWAPALPSVYRGVSCGQTSLLQTFRITVSGAPVQPEISEVRLLPSDFPCWEDSDGDENYLTRVPGPGHAQDYGYGGWSGKTDFRLGCSCRQPGVPQLFGAVHFRTATMPSPRAIRIWDYGYGGWSGKTDFRLGCSCRQPGVPQLFGAVHFRTATMPSPRAIRIWPIRARMASRCRPSGPGSGAADDRPECGNGEDDLQKYPTDASYVLELRCAVFEALEKI